MISRTVAKRIEEGLRFFPVTLLTGARQVGKTALATRIAEARGMGYITLGDEKERFTALTDPDYFLSKHPAPLVIDEVQYAPGLFDTVEGRVDARKHETGENAGMYLLVGCQTYGSMKISQSMAGRVCIVDMSALSLSEILGRPEVPFSADPWVCYGRSRDHALPPEDVFGIAFRGGFPALRRDPGADPSAFYAEYVDTLVGRDVPQFVHVRDETVFRRFLACVAGLSGQELVYSVVANIVGIDVKTAQRWVGVLAGLGVVLLLPPYPWAGPRAVAKRPKLYFRDTGLACYLLDVPDALALESGYLRGPMFETFAFNQIVESYANNGVGAGFYHHRGFGTDGIDLVIRRNGVLTLVDFRAGQSYDASAVKAFRKFDGSGCKVRGCVVCTTDAVYPLENETYALPMTSVRGRPDNPARPKRKKNPRTRSRALGCASRSTPRSPRL